MCGFGKIMLTNMCFFILVTVSLLFILIAVAFIYLLQNVDLQDWNQQKLMGWVDSFGVFTPLATIGLMVLHSFCLFQEKL
jgi:uncharacterized membrane protein YdjX (TVP38/TMEM64 family)